MELKLFITRQVHPQNFLVEIFKKVINCAKHVCFSEDSRLNCIGKRRHMMSQ